MNSNNSADAMLKEEPLDDSITAAPDRAESQTIVTDLDERATLRLEVIQTLLEPCSRSEYGERLRDGAQKLEVSVRTLQRLFKDYQNRGLVALTTSERADRGQHRISEFWQKFIVDTYQTGNKGSRRMTPKQVAIKVQAKARETKDLQPPSYRTVLRVIAPIQERAERAKSIRSPGWRGSTLSVKTRDGKDLDIDHSNHVWQSDHTRLDIMLVDRHGVVIGRPWLTTVIDSYSRALMGINVGFDAPSSQVVALALRHAILPKVYGVEYGLHTEWITYGKPDYLFTDGGKDFRSNHLAEIGTQLGFVHKLRDRPSEGGIVERFFRTLNESVLREYPGYTGSNVQQRPKDAEKDARLTLRELEKIIVSFIVDRHNQSLDARMGDQTHNQRWEAGLIGNPPVMSDRELDICLMKTIRRTVQRGGHITFENVTYRGEYLAGYAGQTVNIRYDPRDITTIWIYRQDRGKEEFITRAHAQGLETEQLSWDEAKASAKRIRDAGKAITNQTILYDAFEQTLEQEATNKPSRKQRQKLEQSYKISNPVKEIQSVDLQLDAPKIFSDENVEEKEVEVIVKTSANEEIEVWDYEQMREDYGW
jgi:putative transposase